MGLLTKTETQAKQFLNIFFIVTKIFMQNAYFSIIN